MLAKKKAARYYFLLDAVGAIAQLGERLHGMQEVSGSIPLGSTTPNIRPFGLSKQLDDFNASPSSRGLGHHPFTVATGVRIPVGTPIIRFRQALPSFEEQGKAKQDSRLVVFWGHSSAGRAPAWHAGGQRFDPAWLHQIQTLGRLNYKKFEVYASPSSRGLGHHPFTVATGVRIPVGTPIQARSLGIPGLFCFLRF
jgi:hypothetical protein